MTFLAALRHDRIDAPWFIEGPIDSASFQAYVEKVLLPTLRPGDIIVTDNLGSHKSKVVYQLTRSAGAKLLFLPKYSPDLNPFERIFAKLEHLLQTAAARIRSAQSSVSPSTPSHPKYAPIASKTQAIKLLPSRFSWWGASVSLSYGPASRKRSIPWMQ